VTAPLSPAALASAARDERLDAHTKAQAAVVARDTFNRRRDLAERALLALLASGTPQISDVLAAHAWRVAEAFDDACRVHEVELCGTEGGR
jgi:hypothetical protein